MMIQAGVDKPKSRGKLALLQWRKRFEGVGLVHPVCWKTAGLNGRCSLRWDRSDPSSSWVTVVAGCCDLLRNSPVRWRFMLNFGAFGLVAAGGGRRTTGVASN